MNNRKLIVGIAVIALEVILICACSSKTSLNASNSPNKTLYDESQTITLCESERCSIAVATANNRISETLAYIESATDEQTEEETTAVVQEEETVAETVAQEEETVVEEVEEELNEYLGNFTLTFYCACTKCCGKNAKGITRSGTKVTEGRTVAVDKSVIPLGTRLLLVWPDGTEHEYIAEDTGSGVNGKHIDIYLETHERAAARGVEHADVYIIKTEGE